jgi:phosphatidylglycerophosphate synthase
MKFKHSYSFRDSLQMHFAGIDPDWKKISQKKWNPWQRVAAATFGIITPGNFMSLLGAIIVVFGLYKLSSGNSPVLAIGMVAFGRAFDLIDGYVADVTGTKSLVGEAVDATLDKLLLFGTLFVVIYEEYVPIWVIAILFAQAIINAGAGLIARALSKVYHPVTQGKWATFAAWTTLLLFASSSLIEVNSLFSDLIRLSAYISFVVFCLYGVQASHIYLKSVAVFIYKTISKVR